MPFAPSLPKRLLFRYLLDWVLIIVTVAVAGSLSYFKPNHRPFNPYDPSISFPHAHLEKIPTSALVCLSVLMPGVVIICFCLLAPATSSAFSRETRETLLKRKLVNLNRALLGLGMAIGLAMFITDGLKNIVGKPRPDLVTRCQPDWKAVDAIVKERFGGNPVGAFEILVTSAVCTTNNTKQLNDGFRSFPSGHSSMSFAGLGYLAIFLYSSFVLTTSQSSPLLPTTSSAARHSGEVMRDSTASSSAASGNNITRKPVNGGSGAGAGGLPSATASLYPPQSLPVLFFIVLSSPLFLASYIASTRFSDFRHHGFDVLSGSTTGIFVAVVASWWYALPSAGGVGRGRSRLGYKFPNLGGLVDGVRLTRNVDPENSRTESHPLVSQGGSMSMDHSRESV